MRPESSRWTVESNGFYSRYCTPCIEMVGTASEESTFGCPECGQEITVDAAMQEAIVANGCPVCTAPVSSESFEP